MAIISLPPSSALCAYLFGIVLSLCCYLVKGQSGDEGENCFIRHTSSWGESVAELRIDVPRCDTGHITWTLPEGHLKLIFEDEPNRDYGVCLEQIDVSPWTAIRNLTQEIDHRMQPLKLPFGRPTCVRSSHGMLVLCLEKPLLRVYRTSLYFDVLRR